MWALWHIASAVSRGPEPVTETKGGCIAPTVFGLHGMAAYPMLVIHRAVLGVPKEETK